MRRRDLSSKRLVSKHESFYNKVQKEIDLSKIKTRNANLRKGLYKQFYQEFKVVLDYVLLKYEDKENISFKWVGDKQQGKAVNYDGEIYLKNRLIEKVEVTCPLRSIIDKIVEEELNDKGSITIEFEDLKDMINANNIQVELITLKKNSMKTYDETVTLVVYVEDMKYYFTDKKLYNNSIKRLEKELKQISYQFKEVYILENLYMYSKKKLIKIK